MKSVFKSSPATTERILEMTELGILQEMPVPLEVLDKWAHDLADAVDSEIINGLGDFLRR